MKTLKSTVIIALNLVILIGALELAARWIWDSVPPERSCKQLLEDERLYGLAPSCSYSAKHWEQVDLITYETDSCGRRSLDRCTADHRADQTWRIATVGDSFTYGAMLPIELQYGSLVKQALQQRLSAPIAVDNYGVEGYDLIQVRGVLSQIDPDDYRIVIYGLTPNDLFTPQDLSLAAKRRSDDTQAALKEKSRREKASFVDRVREGIRRFRSVQVAAHYVFQNDAVYLATYESRGAKAGFISGELTDYWRARLSEFEAFVEEAKSGGFDNLVFLYIPQRIQHVLDKDPETAARARFLGRELRRIVEARGLFFIDGLEALAGLEDDPYFVIDGHLNPMGAQALGSFAGQSLGQNLKHYFP